MARIRTIKPEFWTDETVTECSLTARLLFIGIWNFADDNGNIERSSKQMKMKIFPSDNIEIEPFVLELMAIGLLIEYEYGGSKYLNIRGFKKHQVINKPSKTGHPKYEESLRTTTPLPHHYRTEGKGREGKGIGKESPPPVEIPTEPARMTLFEIRSAFREHTGTEPNGSINNELSEFCKDFTREAIIDALMLTGTRVPRPTNPFSYFRTTLQGRSHNKESPGEEFDPAKDYPEGSFYADLKKQELNRETGLRVPGA